MSLRGFTRILLSAFLPVFIATPSMADEAVEQKDKELQEITVTATKTKRKIEDVPAAVGVVTKDDLKGAKDWNIGSALENVSGVQAQSNNGAYDTHIIIRGAGAKALYGVREIMIMVDGVPITDPDSLSRLDMVDTSMIERIEVVKGPNSTLYGANAAGGIINIITKNPLVMQGAKAKAAFGSYGSKDFHAEYGGSGGENLYYLLSATRRMTDSWRAWNKFDTAQYGGRFDYLVDPRTSASFNLNYSKADLQLPGKLTQDQFEDDFRRQTSEWIHMGRRSEVWRAGIDYKKESAAGNEFKAQLYGHFWQHYHPVTMRINDGGANVYGADMQEDIKFDLGKTKNTLSVGISIQRDEQDSKRYGYKDLYTGVVNGKVVALPPYSKSDAEGMLLNESNNTVDKWGVFVQESLVMPDAASVDLGLRYDEVKFKIDDRIFADWAFITAKNGVSYFNYKEKPREVRIEKTWDAVSPRAGFTYALFKGMNLFANVSTGFQTPTQAELATNENLNPQKSVNYEAGFKAKTKDGHTADLAIYYTKIKQEVIQLMDSAGASYYDNAGRTLHKGAEIGAGIRLIDHLSFKADYTYSDYKFKDYKEMEKAGFPSVIVTNTRDGNRIPLVPMRKYSMSLQYKHPSGPNIRLQRLTWGKYFVDTANTEMYRGFTVYNGRVAYEAKSAEVYLQCDNILNKKYASEVTKSYGKTSYAPGAPRTWMAGVSYSF